MSEQATRRKLGLLAIVSMAGGLLLAFIGIRYLVLPELAAVTFGVPRRPSGNELYYIIGLRNLWLGLLAVAFATFRQWRALAIWFAMGTIVCFADATIAASSTGKLPQIVFHITCGVASAVLAVTLWRVAARHT
jgi:Domain of unknown function (DUF4267)